MNKRTKSWSIGLLALMALAACDGGPSREEFLAEANEICEDSESSLEELSGEAITQEDPGEIIDVALEELSNLRDELGDLEAPDELSDDFDSMIEALDGAVEDIDSLSAAVEEAQEAGADASEETLQDLRETSESLTNNLDQASRAARDMDLEGCGETAEGGS